MENNTSENLYYRELSTLLKFSALINSSLEIESVLNNAMKWAEEFINAEASSIYELDEMNNELFIRLARGEKKEPVKGIRLKMGEGIAGWVVQSCQPIVVHDVRNEKKFSDKYDKITGFKTRSLICVPLTLRGKAIGAIQVLNKKDRESFSNADLDLLTSMSHQIAVAMENAKLYQRLEKKFELTYLELKTAQEKLIRTERLAAMGNLVNGVAHEIRNPITVIGGFTQRIKNLSNDNAEIKKLADIILGETMRLERLVRKVHEFTDVQSASLHPDNLNSVLDSVLNRIRPMAYRQNVEIVSSIDNDLPLIDMDPSQLVIALSNIFENALESIRDSGKIELTVNRVNDHSINIIVKDTGSGIAAEEIDSVYDPFVTSKTRGVGLGLTMVHQIVANHHGEIKIQSRLSEGTTVTIILPVSNKP
ncbi:MAG TPA: ATP-binding protein [Desulfatiglandales bacterium]|nr:ATP-binding protein [Desulfatiglandales bacterium]